MIPKSWAQFPLFIGSKARFQFPMQKLVNGATLFVEPQEARIYLSLYRDRFRFKVLKHNDGGFAYLLNAMLAQAESEGLGWYAFCDDDIYGFRFRGKRMFEINTMMIEVRAMMVERQLAQLMVSFAGHNWYEAGDLKTHVGCWGFILNDVAALRAVGGFDADLPTFTDWDMSARLLRAGYQTGCWYGAMFAHRMKSQPGGQQAFRGRAERLDNCITRLQERYGANVVKRIIAHNQPEPRFRWSLIKPSSRH